MSAVGFEGILQQHADGHGTHSTRYGSNGSHFIGDFFVIHIAAELAVSAFELLRCRLLDEPLCGEEA